MIGDQQTSTIEIFLNGQWIPAASFTPAGKGPYTGVFEYRLDYVFADNPVPLSLALPVTSERTGLDDAGQAQACPAFLLDLVPQGRGRSYLCEKLGLPAGDESDLILAQYGAFNPIGNLRFDTAVRYCRDEAGDVPIKRFSLDEITGRTPEFLEYVFRHAMLSAGTSGVQGAAPKFLLTQDFEGAWFADGALPDADARKHWLVKLPRSSHEDDVAVLRNEAAYMRVADKCGLRTHGEPMLANDMLFVERFDRIVTANRLERRHQESLASLAGILGFGIRASMFDLCRAIIRHASSPAREIAEFIKRDVLNMAMRNTDNHARNTAMQRLPDGTVLLTPLFDFAPMYLDREMIVRNCHWRHDGKIVDRIEDILHILNLKEVDRQNIVRDLRKFAGKVGKLDRIMIDCGVDQRIVDACCQSIEDQNLRLSDLPKPGADSELTL